MNAYILVKLGKERQGIKSDRAFALANGFSTQNIVDWKAGKSLPNWENMEKLASSADMELWEAVKLMKENSVALKEAGYATLPMMSVIAGMSFIGMTQSPALITAVGTMASGLCILCKINETMPEAANDEEYEAHLFM